MAKAIAPTSEVAAASSRKRVMSEIDDIFAKKPKADATAKVPAPTAAIDGTAKPAESLKKSKKAKGKEKAVEEKAGPEEMGATKAAKAPVTIVDSSAAIESYKPVAMPFKRYERDSEEAQRADEEERAFRDSRGTSRRRTDDGLPIYDISELKIGLGGDTELCPFDCNCCF